MAYCASCNKEVKTGKFCNTCGKQLLDSKPAEGVQPVDQAAGAVVGESYKNLAMWAHLAPLLGALVSFAVFFSGFLLWLPGMLIRSSANATEFDKRHATESMNFQLSVLIYAFGVLIIGIPTLTIGWLLAIPLAIGALVFNIMAVVAASSGREYRYPLTIHFVK